MIHIKHARHNGRVFNLDKLYLVRPEQDDWVDIDKYETLKSVCPQVENRAFLKNIGVV
jgi:hypothetical protein